MDTKQNGGAVSGMERQSEEALPDMPYTRCRKMQQKVCTHPYCKDVERRELREQVARVEALADQWAELGDTDSAFWWSTLATHVRATLHPTDGLQ